jgi:hypothetical protein
MRSGRSVVFLLHTLAAVIAIFSLSPRRASAQEEPEALIRQGVELRRQGDNVRSHGYFLRAYNIAHTPRSAAQLGLVEQALGSFADAETHLSEALESSDAWVTENRPLFERSREAVRAHLGKVLIHGLRPGGTVRVGGGPTRTVAADGVLWVTPGTIDLTFAAPGGAAVARQVVVSAGAMASVDVELGAPTAAAPPPAPPAPAAVLARSESDKPAAGGVRVGRVASLTIAGAGVAIAAVGAAVYASGSSKLDAIKRDAAAGSPYDPANGNYRTLGNAGIGLMIAGGVAAAAGATLYFLGRETPAREGGATNVSFGYLPSAGGGLWIARRF